VTVDELQAKRANLVAQRDQMMANLNVTIGAIALCDEFIAKAIADEKKPSRKKQPRS
jgi:hypothetical protein